MTPIVNEGWVIERYIKAASLWADVIIIADQNSTDDGRRIAESYDNVIVIDNPHNDYHEVGMREILYAEARKIIAPKKVLFSIDADEIISGNFADSAEWKEILDLPPGSVIRMPWANLNPDMKTHSGGIVTHCGFVDDGKSMLTGGIMHSVRTPWPQYEIVIFESKELRLLHYAHVNPDRIAAKVRWYSAYEKIARSRFGLATWRQYNNYNTNTSCPILPEWFAHYNEKGVDITSVKYSYDYSHDYRVLEYLDKHGAAYFRKCDIWSKDWVAFATEKKQNPQRFADPRTKLDKLAYKYATSTLNRYPSRIKLIGRRIADTLFKALGY
jgi:hypothetical protein